MHGRGWCKKHHSRWQRHGDPLVTAKRGQGVLIAELRAAGQATGEDCIILETPSGGHRPVAKLGGVLMLASRAVWILTNGHPGEQHVLHTCHRGDEGCINIRHLYLGDNSQNIRDMLAAGRARGGRLGQRKLKVNQVAEIRQQYAAGDVTQAALAAAYGVSRETISNVVRNATWRTATD
ncbi:hypothetical protein [Streptomyces zaomyceticus]|uniref:hypothetical protein n=1 Tax=Streptomyces zaomyceticus TaxID=68286 RepID=UPI003791F0F4